MDKRERKSRLKEILGQVEEVIELVKGTPSDLFEEAREKLEELEGFLEVNCITPDDFDIELLLQNMIKDYFDNDNEVIDMLSQIESYKEEVEEHIEGMREGANKEEWQDFHAELDCIEEVVDIELNDISDIADYIEALEELKDNLENLI